VRAEVKTARAPAGPRTSGAVVVTELSKSYGTVHAVRGLSFTVQNGEIFALLGPNGAGKTTTLEILEGFRGRDGGRVEVLGGDPGDRAGGRVLRERVGLVLQDIAVEPYLTVRETIARDAGYYPAPRDVDEVIGLVGLAGLQRQKVKDLSGGQKRRLDLALGLVGDPELLFLDEPTTGFDPSARRDAWQLVRDLRDAGTTIVLTTHSMDEAQALADRVAVLAGGQIVAAGTPAALGGRDTALTRIRFALPPGTGLAELPAGTVPAGTVPAGTVPDDGVPGDGLVTIQSAEPTETLYQLTGWALRRGVALDQLTVDRPSLEDIYLHLTGHDTPQHPDTPGHSDAPEQSGAPEHPHGPVPGPARERSPR
jgi:ABC-2 type transport system ATP-binding protein